MTRGIADTSVFIVRESGRPISPGELPDELAISVVTVGELRAGVLAAADTETRDRRLATLTGALALDPFRSISPSPKCGLAYRIDLRDMKLRMPVNDSWIAMTAISLGAPVVTHDDDYVAVPGLAIIRA